MHCCTCIGPQAFLEAVYLFMHNLPLADLWQDETWQRHMALLQQQQQEAGSGGGPSEPALFLSSAGAYRPSGGPASLLGPSRLAVGHVHGLGAGYQGLPVRQGLGAPASAGRLLRGQHVAGAGVYERPRSRGSSRDQAVEPLDPMAAAGAAAAARFAALHAYDSASQGSSVERPATAPPGAYSSLLQPATGSTSSAGRQDLSVQQHITGVAQAAMVAAAPGISRRPGANARRAAAARRAALSSALVLAWLPGKHDQELKRMKGQSSTWYFLEQLHISALRANVTIALTSSITKASAAGGSAPGAAVSSAGAARGGLGLAGSAAAGMAASAQVQEEATSDQGPAGMLTEVQRVLVRGMLNRLSGSSGLQLINVSDVGLQLSALDERNRLVNQVGLASLISNHYTWRAYAELRKVCNMRHPPYA